MPNIGPMELVVVLIIALLVLGPKKLPEVGRSVGRGIREFRGSLSGNSHDEAELTGQHRLEDDAAGEVEPVNGEVVATPPQRP